VRRAAHLERRVGVLDQRCAAASARADAAEAAAARAQDEARALEAQLAALIAPADDAASIADASDLGGAAVLYVGGRTGQIPHLRALIERLGGTMPHHSGGSDESTASLPAAIARADVVVFPVDCVSHAAMFDLKRLCKQAAKPYVPLRGTGLAALLSGLAALPKRAPPAAR
jgi:hypothetical protein